MKEFKSSSIPAGILALMKWLAVTKSFGEPSGSSLPELALRTTGWAMFEISSESAGARPDMSLPIAPSALNILDGDTLEEVERARYASHSIA